MAPRSPTANVKLTLSGEGLTPKATQDLVNNAFGGGSASPMASAAAAVIAASMNDPNIKVEEVEEGGTTTVQIEGEGVEQVLHGMLEALAARYPYDTMLTIIAGVGSRAKMMESLREEGTTMMATAGTAATAVAGTGTAVEAKGSVASSITQAEMTEAWKVVQNQAAEVAAVYESLGRQTSIPNVEKAVLELSANSPSVTKEWETGVKLGTELAAAVQSKVEETAQPVEELGKWEVIDELELNADKETEGNNSAALDESSSSSSAMMTSISDAVARKRSASAVQSILSQFSGNYRRKLAVASPLIIRGIEAFPSLFTNFVLTVPAPILAQMIHLASTLDASELTESNSQVPIAIRLIADARGCNPYLPLAIIRYIKESKSFRGWCSALCLNFAAGAQEVAQVAAKVSTSQYLKPCATTEQVRRIETASPTTTTSLVQTTSHSIVSPRITQPSFAVDSVVRGDSVVIPANLGLFADYVAEFVSTGCDANTLGQFLRKTLPNVQESSINSLAHTFIVGAASGMDVSALSKMIVDSIMAANASQQLVETSDFRQIMSTITPAPAATTTAEVVEVLKGTTTIVSPEIQSLAAAVGTTPVIVTRSAYQSAANSKETQSMRSTTAMAASSMMQSKSSASAAAAVTKSTAAAAVSQSKSTRSMLQSKSKVAADISSSVSPAGFQTISSEDIRSTQGSAEVIEQVTEQVVEEAVAEKTEEVETLVEAEVAKEIVEEAVAVEKVEEAIEEVVKEAVAVEKVEEAIEEVVEEAVAVEKVEEAVAVEKVEEAIEELVKEAVAVEKVEEAIEEVVEEAVAVEKVEEAIEEVVEEAVAVEKMEEAIEELGGVEKVEEVVEEVVEAEVAREIAGAEIEAVVETEIKEVVVETAASMADEVKEMKLDVSKSPKSPMELKSLSSTVSVPPFDMSYGKGLLTDIRAAMVASETAYGSSSRLEVEVKSGVTSVSSSDGGELRSLKDVTTSSVIGKVVDEAIKEVRGTASSSVCSSRSALSASRVSKIGSITAKMASTVGENEMVSSVIGRKSVAASEASETARVIEEKLETVEKIEEEAVTTLVEEVEEKAAVETLVEEVEEKAAVETFVEEKVEEVKEIVEEKIEEVEEKVIEEAAATAAVVSSLNVDKTDRSVSSMSATVAEVVKDLKESSRSETASSAAGIEIGQVVTESVSKDVVSSKSVPLFGGSVAAPSLVMGSVSMSPLASGPVQWTSAVTGSSMMASSAAAMAPTTTASTSSFIAAPPMAGTMTASNMAPFVIPSGSSVYSSSMSRSGVAAPVRSVISSSMSPSNMASSSNAMSPSNLGGVSSSHFSSQQPMTMQSSTGLASSGISSTAAAGTAQTVYRGAAEYSSVTSPTTDQSVVTFRPAEQQMGATQLSHTILSPVSGNVMHSGVSPTVSGGFMHSGMSPAAAAVAMHSGGLYSSSVTSPTRAFGTTSTTTYQQSPISGGMVQLPVQVASSTAGLHATATQSAYDQQQQRTMTVGATSPMMMGSTMMMPTTTAGTILSPTHQRVMSGASSAASANLGVSAATAGSMSPTRTLAAATGGATIITSVHPSGVVEVTVESSPLAYHQQSVESPTSGGGMNSPNSWAATLYREYSNKNSLTTAEQMQAGLRPNVMMVGDSGNTTMMYPVVASPVAAYDMSNRSVDQKTVVNQQMSPVLPYKQESATRS